MHHRALRYHRTEDAYNFIVGRLLLQKGLGELGISETIEDIQFEKSGKPYLPSTYFNISHTANMVACIISVEEEIGIDIEKVKEVELKHFDAWFTSTEWERIYQSSFPLSMFYRYWTRKESIIKAAGLGLSNLHEIEIDIEEQVVEHQGKKWHFMDLNIGEAYVGAICSGAELGNPFPISYVDF